MKDERASPLQPMTRDRLSFFELDYSRVFNVLLFCIIWDYFSERIGVTFPLFSGRGPSVSTSL